MDVGEALELLKEQIKQIEDLKKPPALSLGEVYMCQEVYRR